jgi:hypothetical protein
MKQSFRERARVAVDWHYDKLFCGLFVLMAISPLLRRDFLSATGFLTGAAAVLLRERYFRAALSSSVDVEADEPKRLIRLASWRWALSGLAIGLVCAGFVAHWLPKESPRVRVEESGPRPPEAPALGVLTLPTAEDRSRASLYLADDDVMHALERHLGPAAPHWKIAAARPVGDCVLLWLTFPFTADGGADVVYSRSRKLVVCEFTGGERG